MASFLVEVLRLTHKVGFRGFRLAAEGVEGMKRR